MALSKPEVPKSLTDTVIECNWIEDLLPDSDGILQLFKPDDDAEYNHANHFQIRGGGTKMLPEYTHHLITLGVRQTGQKVILTVAHYTNDVKGGARSIFNFLKAAASQTSAAEVKKHEISVTRQVCGDGTWLLYFDEETDKDETGSVIKDLLNGKVSRVRNIYYPSGFADRKHVVSKVTEKIGTAVYKVTSNNCQHFVTEMLLGYGISDQARDHYLAAAFIDLAVDIPSLIIKKGFNIAVKNLMQLPALIAKSETPQQLFGLLIGGLDDSLVPLLKPAFSGVSKATAALKATAIGAAASLAVEIIFFVFVTAHDYWMLRKKKITSRQFTANLMRNVACSTGSVGGTLIGGFIGVFIPLPFGLGICIGAIVGGFIGRFVGGAVGQKALTGGLLEEKIVERLERGAQLGIPASS